MMRSLKAILRQDKEKYRIPRKVQDVIPIKRLWLDGIFQVGGKFSRTWKFTDMVAMRRANTDFGELEKDGTNLRIIQRYIEAIPVNEIELIKLERWTNCNTKEDYRRIAHYWRNEK